MTGKLQNFETKNVKFKQTENAEFETQPKFLSEKMKSVSENS